MSKEEKLKGKLVTPGTTISFQELETLLHKLGYIIKSTGKSAGSRRAYFHPRTEHLLRLHKPHPRNELKKYLKLYIIKELTKNGLI